ncbi:MAG: hypothetical protein OXI37_08235, partial [Gammaproteobacteria bacterium]|nr:hypothetical protein [Gammaproteobacteria bacterium]
PLRGNALVWNFIQPLVLSVHRSAPNFTSQALAESEQQSVRISLLRHPVPHAAGQRLGQTEPALGRRQEARRLFENMLASCNPMGLLSEDLDPKTGELWGNFPQTYSMVGLITSAMRLSRPWEDAF